MQTVHNYLRYKSIYSQLALLPITRVKSFQDLEQPKQGGDLKTICKLFSIYYVIHANCSQLLTLEINLLTVGFIACIPGIIEFLFLTGTKSAERSTSRFPRTLFQTLSIWLSPRISSFDI